MINKGKHHHHVLVINMLLFVAIMFLFDKPNLLLGLYIIAALILFLERTNDLKFFLSVLVFAVVVEAVSVSRGIWSYPNVDNVLGVPYWILMMWSVSALSVHRAGEYLKSKMS